MATLQKVISVSKKSDYQVLQQSFSAKGVSVEEVVGGDFVNYTIWVNKRDSAKAFEVLQEIRRSAAQLDSRARLQGSWSEFYWSAFASIFIPVLMPFMASIYFVRALISKEEVNWWGLVLSVPLWVAGFAIFALFPLLLF